MIALGSLRILEPQGLQTQFDGQRIQIHAVDALRQHARPQLAAQVGTYLRISYR